MEYAVNGNLFDYIKSHVYVDEVQSRIWFRQLINAMEYCHSCHIAHRYITKHPSKTKMMRTQFLFDWKMLNFQLQRHKMREYSTRRIFQHQVIWFWVCSQCFCGKQSRRARQHILRQLRLRRSWDFKRPAVQSDDFWHLVNGCCALCYGLRMSSFWWHKLLRSSESMEI